MTAERSDELRIIYTRFINTSRGRADGTKAASGRAQNDFKRGRPTSSADEEYDRSYILYDPSPKEVLNALIPQLLIVLMSGCAIAPAYAVKGTASRMAAMENATRSADKMIEKTDAAISRRAPAHHYQRTSRYHRRRKRGKCGKVSRRRLLSGGETPMTEQERTGSIIRIIGPVLDVRFKEGSEPLIKTPLSPRRSHLSISRLYHHPWRVPPRWNPQKGFLRR